MNKVAGCLNFQYFTLIILPCMDFIQPLFFLMPTVKIYVITTFKKLTKESEKMQQMQRCCPGGMVQKLRLMIFIVRKAFSLRWHRAKLKHIRKFMVLKKDKVLQLRSHIVTMTGHWGKWQKNWEKMMITGISMVVAQTIAIYTIRKQN